MLRQTEVQTAQGKSIAVACKEAVLVKEYDGPKYSFCSPWVEVAYDYRSALFRLPKPLAA
nr:hypothetical protein [Methylobacterium oxalidis]